MLREGVQAIREVVNSISPKNAFVPLKQAFKKFDDPVVGVCRGILSSLFAIDILFDSITTKNSHVSAAAVYELCRVTIYIHGQQSRRSHKYGNFVIKK